MVIELKEAIDTAIKSLAGIQRIQVKFNNEIFHIAQIEINFIKSCGGYTKIYTENMVYESGKTLKRWMEELDKYIFIECHKSYIVNLTKVVYIGKSILHIKDGKEIPVSRRRSKYVKQRFAEYNLHKT